MVVRLIGPELTGANSSIGVVGVEGHEIQRNHVVKDKVPASTGIQGVKGAEHAVRVVCKRLSRHLAIRKESIRPEVVCSDPHYIYGITICQRGGECRLASGTV